MTAIGQNHAADLRRELIERAASYAVAQGLDLHAYRSRGRPGVVLFRAYEEHGQSCHGNFQPSSYRTILGNDTWRKRLEKAHQSRQCLHEADRAAAKELDSCCSSDALLMNIFCHPSTATNSALARLFGFEKLPAPDFGWKPRLPMIDGSPEPRSTEIDMYLFSPERVAVCEAKLTEKGFTNKSAKHVRKYRDFGTIFDEARLPPCDGAFEHYQLIRNVLAAHRDHAAFYLLYDQRRPDIEEAFEAVKAAIVLPALSARCIRLTWQTIAKALAKDLNLFLGEKYGIFCSSAGE